MMFVAFLAVAMAAADQTAQGPLAAAAEQARQKNSPEAVTLYQKALEANPAWQEGWFGLGTLEYQKDHYPECAAAFTQLVRLLPKSGPALALEGLCEAGMKNNAAAIDHLRRGLELGIGTEAIARTSRYQLARLLTHAGSFEEAMGVLTQLAESGDESSAFTLLAGAAALWRPIFPEEIRPEDREMLYLAGRAFWHSGARNAAAAESDLHELSTRYPNAPGVHFFYGSFELRNEPDRAVSEFELELKTNPRHVGALAALAAEYLRRDDPEQGIPYARRLLDVLPESVAPHTLLGRLLAMKGDLQGGIKELEKAREVDPNDPQPHIALASLYAKAGRPQDAAKERAAFSRINAGEKK